jgi:hypothetical protein
MKDPGADIMAYRVIHRIPGDGRNRKRDEEPFHLKRALEIGIGGKGAEAEEERIPREDRGHDQPRFAEDDEKDHDIGPDSEILKDVPQIPVKVQEEVDTVYEQIRHRLFFHSPV